MNRRRVAALLRELAEELERDDAPANDTRQETRRRRPVKANAEDVAKAAELLRRRGVVPSSQ